MKRGLKTVCCFVFLGGTFALLLFLLFALLRLLMLQEKIVFQLLVLAVLAALILAYFAGAAFTVVKIKKRNMKG